MKTASLILTILATAFANGLFAQQPGDLDVTFDGDGIVTTPVGTGSDVAYLLLVIQPDGKIVVAGYADNGNDGRLALVWYNADGSPDAGFGTDGKVITDVSGYGRLACQPDGKIIAVAAICDTLMPYDFLVVRCNTDGTLDTGFGTGGEVITDFNGPGDFPTSVVIQPDGKIVVAGYSGDGLSQGSFAAARYNSDGALDNSFSADGKVTIAITVTTEPIAMALQPDGKIIAAGALFVDTITGYDFSLVRLNADGTLDNSFSSDGKFRPLPFRLKCGHP